MPVVPGAEPNRYHVPLLIHLLPYGLYQITGKNQAGFADKRLWLADIDSSLFRSLHQAFVTAENAIDLVNACDNILYRRMEKNIVSDALLLADTLISNSYRQIKVKEAARQTCYSERQLNRLFLAQVGMNIKNYARLARFNYVLKHICGNETCGRLTVGA